MHRVLVLTYQDLTRTGKDVDVLDLEVQHFKGDYHKDALEMDVVVYVENGQQVKILKSRIGMKVNISIGE